jgi:hypothetical protein
VKNELESASRDEPLSVLIADIGAVPTPKPDKVSVTESEVQVPESEISSILQSEGAKKTLLNGPCTADSSVESGEMTFGGGDRTGLFLLIERIKDCVGEVGGGIEARNATARGAAVTGHVSAATDSSSRSVSDNNNDDTTSNNDSSADNTGMNSTNCVCNNISNNAMHDRPKISLSDVTPQDKEKEREKERAKSAQIIAIAKESTAASEQERIHSQGEAKARLACRLKDRSHPPIPTPTLPSSGDAKIAGKIGTVRVGSGQGEDGMNGVKDPLQPDVGVGLRDNVHSTDGARAHNSSSTDTDGRTPSLCISQLLYDLNSADLKKDISKRLFITHAQYKFAYKIACDMCRKK